MKRYLIGLLAVSLMAVTLSAVTPPAHAGTDPIRLGVHIVGDSITYRAHVYKTSPLSAARRPDGWTYDAFPGRRVTALGTHYVPRTTDYWTAVKHMFTPPRQEVATGVIALGTNGADEVMTVSEAAALYAAGVRRLRASLNWRGPKRIVLVTPWRDPSIEEGGVNPFTGRSYPPYQWASKSEVYQQAIYRVSRNSSGVCVMPWHRYAAAHPEWFRDGVHPQAEGLTVWKNLLVRTIRECA